MAAPIQEHAYNLECRDPLYGFVYLSKAEWAIVDCPTFQRLRDIRQLAMAHLVYPGATHTRFEHSLGCVHLSDMIYQAVRRQVDQGQCPNFAKAFRADDKQVERGRQLLRLAGLLHDLGHTPFSHSGESLMPVVDGEKVTHEKMTGRLIRDTEIQKALEREFGNTLGKDVVEEVIAVATSIESAKLDGSPDRAWYRFLNDILTGELGSDRIDYLLRDAVHSGQSAGAFDYRKLIDSMMIVEPPKETGEDYRLGLDEAGWLVGEQMVAARYLMYVSLYFHKTKRIYEIHLEEFLANWLAHKYGQPHFPTEQPAEYARLTDSPVWAAIYAAAQGSDEALKAMAKPFVERTHLRLAYELLLADNYDPRIPQDDVTEAVRAVGDGLRPLLQREQDFSRAMELLQSHLGPALRRRRSRIWDKSRFDKLVKAAQNHVRGKLGVIRDDQPTHQAAKFFQPKNKIWVFLNGETRYLDDLSEIVSGMPERIWRGRIYAAESVREDVAHFCKDWVGENPAGGGADDAGIES